MHAHLTTWMHTHHVFLFHHMQTVAAILGEGKLPWEGLRHKLVELRPPVLAMLHRNPSLRPCMASFHTSAMEGI